MSSVKEKPMKRKLFGTLEHDEKNDSNSASAEKKRRRKNALETPKHYPKSERQQLALVLQMTSAENSPEPAGSPPPNVRKTPGGSGRKDKINKRNQRGETSLHRCTIRGDLDMMKELISQGADVNVQDFAGWTPLHEACNHGHQEITQFLLQAGANVNSKGLEDDTPLHDAVTNSHRALVELLLKHGANPLLKNKRGERPLDIAEDKVIRELMQKEVIDTDGDSGSDADCASPLQSEDSVGSRKNVEKGRTTSTSSSGFQDLYKREKKKRKKQKTESNKTLTASPLTSDSSSDSDSSDDSSITSITSSHGGPSHSNGYASSIGKTPSVSASLLKTPKSAKKKRKHQDKSERKLVKIQSGNFEDLTSSDASSDSDIRVKREQKYNNGTHSQQIGEYSKYSLNKNDKKDLTSKPKSLYLNPNDKLPNTKQESGFQRKKLSHPSDQVKRARSSSHDADFSQSKSKSKPSKLFDERLKTFSENIIPKVNGFQTAPHSVEEKNSFTDESIYDFSLSAEESTNSSAISLKHKYDMKSSELFDMICLGKPSKEPAVDVKKEFIQEGNELPTMKLERKLSKDKSAFSSIRNDDQGLDKNHNKILSEFSDKTTKKTSVLSNGLHTHNHVIPKQENSNKIVETPVKSVSVSKSLTAGFMTENRGEETKSEKKMKKHHSSSPKKTLGNGPKASIKADISVKKELQKSDSNDAKSEKLKKFSSFDGELLKTPSGDKISGSVKKKKKHKHKHSHDTPSGEHKHRHKVGSTDHSSSDKPTSDKGSVQNKSLLKKTDSSKSLQSAPSSRKNSYEGRPMEGSVTPAAKKKARSTDSASSETSNKGSKHSSVSKTPKSSSVPQEKRQSSVKKDKPETKKRAIISDGSSFFLSELEKSSRIRMEQEKKIKQQRKKKLLQQQKLKAQSAVENSSKDSKLNTPTSEKSQPTFTDKPGSMDFIDTTKQIRPHALSVDYQTDGTFAYRSNNIDPFQVHSNSMDRPDFAMFKGVGARSVSQMDQKPCYSQIPPHIVQEKKHLPVQRSLSFSGQPPDVKMPVGFQHNPGLEAKTNLPLHFHEGVRHRHSVGDNQTLHTGVKIPVHPNAPTNIPPPHPVNGPLLPPANHLPPHSYVPGPIAHPAQHKPGPYQVGPTLLPGTPVANAIGNSASIPSNVPISSPLVAKVPVHPAVATPPTGSTTNASQAPSTENKCEQVPTTEAKIDKESSSVKEDTEENVAEKDDITSSDAKPKEEDFVIKKRVKTEREIQEEEAIILARKQEEERKLALEQYIKDRLSKMDVVIEEPTPKKLPVFIPMEKLKKSTGKDPIQDRLNVYEEWAAIQKQINERRKKYYTAVVIPQAPHCYCDYMTYTGAYLLSDSRESWLSVPVLAPPPSLGEEMRALFMEHEKERVKLRLQHATQREKLIVACEQEIMRVHGRAARMLQNQQIPLSACSVFLDREMYNLDRRGKKSSEDSNNTRASIRDRFNGRMLLSWLQDVDDKYVKTKNVLLQRQRHESQALHAVQRMEWFLKLQEVENQGQQKRWTNSKPEDVSELYVPPVNISDDFNLLPG